MNKKRRNRISNVVSRIGFVKKDLKALSGGLPSIKSELEDILYEEEYYYDNMPENLQGSMRGIAAEEAIDYITEAMDMVDEAIKSTDEENTIELLDEAMSSLNYI